MPDNCEDGNISTEKKENKLNGTFNTDDDYYTLDKLMKYKETLTTTPILIKEWKGHKLGVTGITSYSDPVFFASSGQDLKIIVWNNKFEQIGTLTTIRDPNWGLVIDVEKKKKERRKDALELYDKIKDLPYEELFDGNMNLQNLEVT